MPLDTDTTTHTGMGGQSRCTRYLVMQVWCGLLTAAVVVLAAVLVSVKLSVTEKDGVSTSSQDSVTPGNTHSKITSDPFSFIQLIMGLDHRWQTDREISSCDSCSLVVQNNSIHCTRGGLYFSYAHVTFIEKKGRQTRRNVTLYKNARYGREERLLFMAVDSTGKGGSVSVSKIIKLEEGDSVSLSISNDCLTEPHDTYWGAYRIL